MKLKKFQRDHYARAALLKGADAGSRTRHRQVVRSVLHFLRLAGTAGTHRRTVGSARPTQQPLFTMHGSDLQDILRTE